MSPPESLVDYFTFDGELLYDDFIALLEDFAEAGVIRFLRDDAPFIIEVTALAP